MTHTENRFFIEIEILSRFKSTVLVQIPKDISRHDKHMRSDRFSIMTLDIGYKWAVYGMVYMHIADLVIWL